MDATSTGTKSHKSAAFLPVPAGLLLCVCFFLPMAKDCSGVVYPYREVQFQIVSGTYLLGLTAALVTLLGRFPAWPRLLSGARWVHFAMASLGQVPLWLILLSRDHDVLAKVLLVGLWLVPLAVLWRGLRLRSDPLSWMARCHLAGARQGLAWFHDVFWSYQQVYYGFWLSVVSTAGL